MSRFVVIKCSGCGNSVDFKYKEGYYCVKCALLQEISELENLRCSYEFHRRNEGHEKKIS